MAARLRTGLIIVALLAAAPGMAIAATYIGNGSGAVAVALPIPCGVALTAAGVSNTAEVWVTSRF